MAKLIDLGNSATALKSSGFKVLSTFARADWQHWASPGRSPSTTPKQGSHRKQAGSAEDSDCCRIPSDEAGLKSKHRSDSGGSTALRHIQSQGRSQSVHWSLDQWDSWPGKCTAKLQIPQSCSIAQTRALWPSLSLNRIPGLMSKGRGWRWGWWGQWRGLGAIRAPTRVEVAAYGLWWHFCQQCHWPL